jgi:hypothetical protein
MHKDKLWLVEFYKQSYLHKEKVLVSFDDLWDVVRHYTWTYPDYDPTADYILIKPSDITYYSNNQEMIEDGE